MSDASPEAAAPRTPHVLFQLRRRWFAVPAASVLQIARCDDGTPAPLEDLGKRLQIQSGNAEPPNRVLVVIHEDERRCWPVQGVAGVCLLTADTLHRPPALAQVAGGIFIRGVADVEGQPVYVLDVERLLAGAPVPA